MADVMIVDYNKCVRVAKGDEMLNETSVPYHCPICAKGVDVTDENDETTHLRYLTSGSFSAKLRLGGQKVPVCTDHKDKVYMVPV